jgi:hypothetical protein
LRRAPVLLVREQLGQVGGLRRGQAEMEGHTRHFLGAAEAACVAQQAVFGPPGDERGGFGFDKERLIRWQEGDS